MYVEKVWRTNEQTDLCIVLRYAQLIMYLLQYINRILIFRCFSGKGRLDGFWAVHHWTNCLFSPPGQNSNLTVRLSIRIQIFVWSDVLFKALFHSKLKLLNFLLLFIWFNLSNKRVEQDKKIKSKDHVRHPWTVAAL